MTELLAALGLGVAGGLAPGPLHSLILTTALRRGMRPAIRLAFAPLISDALPVLASLILASTMSDVFARGLGLAGGLVVIGMGVGYARAPEEPVTSGPGGGAARDYLRGAFVNILNPHPWLFWLGAGAPLLAVAFRSGTSFGVAWLAVFYVGLVGLKVVLAVVVARGRHRLDGRWLHRSVVASAVLMVGIGAWLVWEAATGRL